MAEFNASGESSVRLAPGITFGRYVIGRQLGAGGMGAVFEATHIDLKKRVAVKVMLPEAAQNAMARARFLREGEAVAKLRHPNVVDIADVGVMGDTPYLVMEFLEGEDLGHLLDRVRSLPLAALVDLMLPVLDAVSAAHEVGIVHRDLKPENIFLARTRHSSQEPKLLDFGISKLGDMGTAGNLTATNTMMGTAVYMSPEQAQNSKDVDARADQYSLGAILYEASVGAHPFAEVAQRDSLFELLTAIVGGRYAPLRALRPDLPEGFERVVLRAMAPRREDRFRDVSDLARALLPFASPAGQVTWSSRLGAASEVGTPMPVASPFAGPGPRLDAPTFVAGAPAARSPGEPVTPRMAVQQTSTLGASARSVEVPPMAPPAARRTSSRLAAAGSAVLVAGVAIAAFALSSGGSPPASPPRPTVAAPPPAPRP
ncbi:MAG: protein kinase, partial [Deltaproteobacteria bacterium]|nr:protein kinase [Deltaproteobacteria bacterium]